jgi:hypothetical protein
MATATVLRHEPMAWRTTLHYPDGACCRCAHRTGADAGLACASPDVAGRGAPVPVAQARQFGGACGIEARHHQYRAAA